MTKEELEQSLSEITITEKKPRGSYKDENNRKTVQFNIRFTNKEKDRLSEKSKELDLPESTLIRLALMEFYAKH